MALGRAFTKRAKRQHEASSPSSDATFRFAPGTIERSKISLPTQLLSTTNVHALSAPDIRSISSASSNASLRSADDSDFSPILKSSLGTPATSPEPSSIESSPITPESAQRKAFFHPLAPKRWPNPAGDWPSRGAESSADIPALPQRAPSHSKQAHQDLAHKRSLSRLTPPPTLLSDTTIIRNSADIFGGAAVDPSHPFGNELAQVREMAEEFGGVSALLDEEEQDLRMKGLLRFGAEDYVNEISGFWGDVFDERLSELASPWI